MPGCVMGEGCVQAVEGIPTGPGDAGGEGVGDRRVERLARTAGEDRDRRGDPDQAVGIEARQSGVGQDAVALTLEERPGPGREAVPGGVPGDGAQERLGGRGGAARPVGLRHGDGELGERGPGRRVRDGSVRRLAGDHGGDPVRVAGGELQAQRAAEAHAHDGRPVDPAGVEIGDEVVHVDDDVERARVREAARAAAAAVQGMDGDVAGPGEGGGQAVQLGGGRERAVEEEDLARPRARHPPADGVAAGPRELAGPLASEERAHGIAAQLAPGGAGQGVEADEARRDLEPGEGRPDMGGQRVVAGIRRAGQQDDGGHRDLAEDGVRARDHGGVADRRVLEEDRLHLGRADVLAAADDAVETAVDDEQPALRIETAEVAGPDGCLGRRRCPGLAEVAREPGGALDHDLPHPVPVLAGDRDAHAGERAAGRARVVPGVPRRERRDP